MGVVVSIDAGTTGVRSFAVDETGTPVGASHREFPQYFPRPGWVEHDALEIWAAVQDTLAELMSVLDEPVAAIGVTNQRETAVAWDRRSGLPRHRAIVWQDRRTASRCEQLAQEGKLPLVRERTGLVLDPYFSGSKFEWMLRHGDVEVDEALAIGTVDSWIVWNLTGGAHVTDPSNACRTMLFDIHDMIWSSELCELFGVPIEQLGQVMPSSGPVGATRSGLAVPAGVVVSGMAGDQQAALFGQACVRPGQAKNTYGTGSFVLMNVGATCPEPVEGLLTSVAWKLDDRPGSTTYALEGAVFVTGAAIQWLRDGLGIIAEASEVGPLAESVDDSGGVVFVPALTGLGSPWWDARARGTILGLTRGTGRAHIARATLDAIAMQCRDVIDSMTASADHPVSELRVDGGASVADLLLTLQADQLQVPVIRSQVQETTALGAAYLAGLGAGVWSSTDELEDLWTADATFEPSCTREAADLDHARWLRGLERSRGWDTEG